MTVENFRAVNGINRIYRCAKTEPLAGVANPRTEAEHVILRQSGLIIDLRSQSERDDDQVQQWMDRYGFEAVDARVTKYDGVNGDDDDDMNDVPPLLEKRVLRIDVQPRERIYKYMIRCWLTPAERAMAPVLTLVDPDALQAICLDALNARGLAGLNEAILETGGEDLCFALKEMTKHLENSDTSLVFHCVQGKDRTGVLSMLCQSILGQSDEEIIEEYFISDINMRDHSVAALKAVKGKFDKRRFTGAPREAMVDTLSFVRRKYGSVCPGYLDAIGFDRLWRDRFLACVAGDKATSESKL